MDNPQLLRIQENLKLLKLNLTGQQLEMLLQEASKNEVSYSDFLDKLLEEEISLKQEKQMSLNTVVLPRKSPWLTYENSMCPNGSSKKLPKSSPESRSAGWR